MGSKDRGSWFVLQANIRLPVGKNSN